MTEISTPKFDLAKDLAGYSWKERKQIVRAAKHLRKFVDLTSEEFSLNEEADEVIEELEEDK